MSELCFIDTYAGILKMLDEFEMSNADDALDYDFSSVEFAKLRQKYYLEQIAGNGNDFEKARNLMFWLNKNTFHVSDYDNHVQSDALSLLEYSLNMGKDRGINCRALSVILTECLLALGIYARTIYMMPFSPYDMDNHVCTHVYASQIGKWVMFDPTFNCYSMDENENPLDLIELRRLLAERKQIFFNREINYNRQKKLEYGESKINIEPYYTEYLAKNVFYFLTCRKSGYGTDGQSANRLCFVLPKGYDLVKSKICNLEYRFCQASECDGGKIDGNLSSYRQKIEAAKSEYLLISPLALLRVT